MTETLRTNYPMMFMQDNRALVDDMEVIFSDSENKSILLRKGDSVYRVDLPSKQVKKLEAPDLVAMKLPEAIPQKIIDRSRAKMPEPVYNLPFDGYLVNLPTTRQLPKGAVSVRFTHRFSSSTFNQRRRYGTPFDLFGLDSTATVGYGVSYGLTRRISIGVYRSRFDYLSRAIGGKGENPIEFNGDFHIFQESEGRFPISLVARAALEGDNFFKDFFRPDLQLIVGRSVGSFATVYLVPTVSFNTNPRPRGRELPGEKHSTVALGIGASLRPLKRLPRLALVGEYVPRLWGFNIWNNNYKPTASAGIQFRTYRHAFSFVVTNTRGTTTSAYGQGDTSSFSSHPIDAFSLGFNITRQLH